VRVRVATLFAAKPLFEAMLLLRIVQPGNTFAISMPPA
jgi:hypothetical protein